MHKKSLGLLLTIFLLGAPVSGANDGFAAFFAQFKTALKKRDKAAIADMTKLPFLYGSKYLNKKEFIAKFDEILPRKLYDCFSKEKPVIDQQSAYSVFCGEEIYVFSKEKGQYKFTDIGVND